jgi:serine/threonine protein kinase
LSFLQQNKQTRTKSTTTTTNSYKRGRHLGKGGFATCYAFTSLDSKRTYAGKCIPKASLIKSSARRKLINEIRIHRSINDPHVVKFLRYFEGIVYIVVPHDDD